MQTTSLVKIWLLCVNTETSIYEERDQPQPPIYKRSNTIGRAFRSFIDVNFSKLIKHNSKIFRNSFVCIHYHLSKIQIFEFKF